MSFYRNPRYTESFYGTGPNGEIPGGPADLRAYQNNADTIILYWGFDPVSPYLSSFTWTIDTDLVDTFDSSYFYSYTSTANPDFIDGGVHKGLAVPAYPRLQGESRRVYWRVSGERGGISTPFVSSYYDMPEAINILTSQSMMDLLPDVIYKKDYAAGDYQLQAIVFNRALTSGNVYNLAVNGVALIPTTYTTSSDNTLALIAAKIAAVSGVGSATVTSGGTGTDDDREIVIRAAEKDSAVSLFGSSVTGGSVKVSTITESRNTSNIKRLFDAIGSERDLLNLETIFTNNDLFTNSVRDISIKNNFGVLVDIEQPVSMKTIDFREIVRAFRKWTGDTPSIASIAEVIKSMFGVYPDFSLIRDTLGMYVNDPSTTFVDPFYVDDPLSVPPVDPETVWDNNNLAFGVIIYINNPMSLPITRQFVENVVYKMTPVHSPVYIVGI